MTEWGVVMWGVVIGLVLLVVYYVLLVRAVLEMLRSEANRVLMTFSFLGLIPMPPFIILGILMMIIWRLHMRERAL